MIPAIITNFRAAGSFHKSGEVDLFRNLARAITAHSRSTFIDETHGRVCNVSFTSVTGKPETCEIADLLIISHASNVLRATFWQAKKQGKSKWLGVTTGNEQLDFNGQFNQWDLLCRRPTISGVGSFKPPVDLLSSFASASIGSFGVFYQRGSLIEVSHSVAEAVACHNPTVKHPKMAINGYLSKYHYMDQEVIARPALDGFLQALFSAQVGARLDPAKQAHRWLVQYALSKAATAEHGAADLGPLERFPRNDGPPDDPVGSPGDGLSVLIVGAQGDSATS